MSGFDCVGELVRVSVDGGPPVWPGPTVWHVAKTRGRTSDFVPIRCSTDEGITFPGHIERRAPTCPDCRRIVGLAEPAASGGGS